ncbi:extracellular solute-binding protein [Streptococcus sp. S784/96/1]|uniref:extracellular solute-binding protein n=1 Tax=Streptococcus sp. S784/96/1 TaxID=2653499 RepID=UPI001386ED53|nr:extracellular solute-binding protein [Streptococcus sp. S784/96/1]
MKMNWKKFVVGAVTLTSAVTLAACGKSDSKTEKVDDKTLTVGVDKLYVDYINGIKGEFEKEHGVKLEVKEVDQSDVLTNLPTDGPTGTSPDVMMAPYDRVGGLGSEGHLAEVKLGNKDDFDDTVKSLVTLDGKVYGEPSVVETLVLYYNKDLVQKTPTTFADLEALQKDPKFAFESEAGKSTGFLANWTNFYYAYGLTSAYGGYAFGKDGTDASDIGIAAGDSIDGLKYAKTWYGMWPQGMQDTTKAGSFVTDQFIAGKVGALIDGPWVAASFKDAGINYGAAVIPTLPNGGKYGAFAGGKAWVISNYSDNKTMAQEFLDYVTNSDNQKEFYTQTQEIPANTVARTFASEQGNELTKAVIQQFADAKPMPNIPQMAEVWEPAATMYFDVVSGTKEPEAAAKDALSTITDAIEQKYGE